MFSAGNCWIKHDDALCESQQAALFHAFFSPHLDVLTHSFLSHSFHLLPFSCISLVFSFSLSHVLSQVINAHTHTDTKSSVVDRTEHAHKAPSPCTVTETEKKPEEDVKVREDGYSWLANSMRETPKKLNRRTVILWCWWGGGWRWGWWNMQRMKRLWWWNSSR